VTNSSIRGFETVKTHVEPAKMRIANFKQIDWEKIDKNLMGRSPNRKNQSPK
jgi:hypothetical protein